jgi:hypothetical protein
MLPHLLCDIDQLPDHGVEHVTIGAVLEPVSIVIGLIRERQ